jgi:hypothetical protein
LKEKQISFKEPYLEEQPFPLSTGLAIARESERLIFFEWIILV